jgi:hypothetical protein
MVTFGNSSSVLTQNARFGRRLRGLTPSQERDLRHHLDSAIGRALVDPDYEVELLRRPQENLGTQEVAGSYTTLQELAQHLLRLFWRAGTPQAFSLGLVLIFIGGVMAWRQVLGNSS